MLKWSMHIDMLNNIDIYLNNHSKELLRCENVMVVSNDAASFDDKMHPNFIDDLIGLKKIF